MKSLFDTLGSHVTLGQVVLVLACVSLFGLEVVRQTRVAVAPRVLHLARASAGLLSVGAFVLIVARFVSVGGLL